MRPYVLVTGDFVRTGGMDVANFALARYLGRSGADVHLVAHRADPELLAMPNVILHRVAKPVNSYLLGAPGLRRAARRCVRALEARAPRLLANGGNYDSRDTNWVHYVHAAYTPAVAGSPLRQVVGRWAHRRFVADERRALRQARVVVTNSDRTRSDVVEHAGAAPERVHTVYYGTDADHHRPPTAAERIAARATLGWHDDVPGVAFVGALGDRRKGFDIVFAAWERLCSDPGWTPRLVVIGAGQELPAWRARVHDLGLSHRVHFTGFTRDVRGVLWACDALVAPARYEAYGLAVHEAVCCGLPVIVSANSGVVERIPGLEGLRLAAPADPDRLVSALRQWMAARDAWQSAALAASGVLRAWTWDHMAARIVSLMTGDGTQ